jgi:NAD(P)-dependent dehydrogenase (short-subunit alcohol dehydrogenase family)
MNTNFVGSINVTNAVLPSMRARRDGTVVFIGSRSAYRTTIPVSPPPPFLCIIHPLSHLSTHLSRALVSTRSQCAVDTQAPDFHSRL